MRKMSNYKRVDQITHERVSEEKRGEEERRRKRRKRGEACNISSVSIKKIMKNYMLIRKQVRRDGRKKLKERNEKA